MALVIEGASSIESTVYKQGSVTLSNTFSEINDSLAGNTASAAELTRAADVSTRIVDVTSATLTITALAHGSRTMTLNRAAGVTVTLPAATGTGEIFRFYIGTSVTSNNYIIQVANASDVMDGGLVVMQDFDVDGTLSMFRADAGDDTITLSPTTTGGLKGGTIEIQDVANNLFSVSANVQGSGVLATPFSAAV
jgi:hypothetical protein